MMTGCDEFLDKKPSVSGNIVPESVDDMDMLLGKFRYDQTSDYAMLSSDDTKPNLNLSSLYSIEDIHIATWEREVSPVNYPDYQWQYRYIGIFEMNMVLSILKDSDASEAEKQRIKSQACFKRAYLNFALVNLYALPYCAENLQEPGIPLKKATAFDEDLSRATIEQTYQFIEEDLEEALKLDYALTNTVGINSPSRATTPGVYAFAARYYLAKHDYKNAQLYADKALAIYGVDKIKDLNNFAYGTTEPGVITINGKEVEYELNFSAYYNNWDYSFFSEEYFKGTIDGSYRNHQNWMYPSQELMDTYEKDGSKATDWRWKYFFVEHFSYKKGSTYDYPALVYTGYGLPNGLSVPEMLLIKGECQARTGQWQDGLTTVNILRAKRIDPKGVVNLSATSQDEAIRKILDERRREMPIAMRWYDLRRYNNNDYAGDDVVVTKKYYPYSDLRVLSNEPVKTYTLEKKDRRYAAPIPDSDLAASDGAIQQNKY